MRTLCAREGRLTQYAYPLDSPETFRRDQAAGPFDWSDPQVSELTVVDEDQLSLLERGSHTTMLYSVRLDPELALPVRLAGPCRRLSLEVLSGCQSDVPLLRKRLVLSPMTTHQSGPT